MRFWTRHCLLAKNQGNDSDRIYSCQDIFCQSTVVAYLCLFSLESSCFLLGRLALSLEPMRHAPQMRDGIRERLVRVGFASLVIKLGKDAFRRVLNHSNAYAPHPTRLKLIKSQTSTLKFTSVVVILCALSFNHSAVRTCGFNSIKRRPFVSFIAFENI